MQASVPGDAIRGLGGALLPLCAFLRAAVTPAPLPQRGLLCQRGLHVRRDGGRVWIWRGRRRRRKPLPSDESRHVGDDAALPSLHGGRRGLPALRRSLHQHCRRHTRGPAPSVHHGSQTAV